MEGFLTEALAVEEVVEQGQVVGGDGGAVGALGEQVTGVHGDEKGGVGIGDLDLPDGGFANGEVGGEIDFLKG